MADKPPKVERKAFEDVVKGLLRQQPMKRDEIEKASKKPSRIISQTIDHEPKEQT